ncbi:hypothetical protein CAPTEDRAFT_174814 [Capitella teleta]|uniref:F-box protein Hrt3/FBXO9 C-terminal domain-containing protein n=1 Tax=Capitella teleta TaxID=283909 RepID=R7UX38_CAPTE|nr:hypothetical protein CAPTEDRAFT_174814 [Capitella teleta]|eukprot:ELU10842.1 hypothetical protein CAPTEDRAFT_174814 [Capitella teleta]
MYFKRPHLNYHGCYISRCTYFRQGEMILDSFYRPYQMVEYFRYIRFFPDGQMLMLTSPDPPVMIVGKMKSRNCGLQGILFGYYKMNGNQITGILKRRRTDHTPTMFRYRRKNRNNQNEDSIEQTFNLKLELTHSKNRRHSVLMWISYSIHSKYRLSGQENVAEFELKDDTYPALVFSKVKSYTAVASKPLSANIHLRYG